MPQEIFSLDVFNDLVPFASVCYMKTLKDGVKLKLRTKKVLYTYKTDVTNTEKIIKDLKSKRVTVVEIPRR